MKREILRIGYSFYKGYYIKGFLKGLFIGICLKDRMPKTPIIYITKNVDWYFEY